MRRFALLLVTLLLLAAAPWARAQQGATRENGQPLIMNYWTYLQSILEENKDQRVTKTMRPDGHILTRVNYPFDAISHLKPAHLIRAAKEGIDFARTEGWGLAPEAAEEQAYRNVGVALEFFPILAINREDFMPLLIDMARRQEDPVFRTFLLNHIMPGLAHPSLFGRYMQEQFYALDVAEARQYLLEPATFPLENATVQAAAVRALFAYDKAWFTEKLATLPEVADYARANTLTVEPAILLRDDAPVLSGDIGAFMRGLIKSIGDEAEYLAQIAAAGSDRPEGLKAVAREYAQRILANFPIANADTVRAGLESAPPAVTPSGDAAP